jgi:uncharacterized protein YidB (DUF937 family)
MTTTTNANSSATANFAKAISAALSTRAPRGEAAAKRAAEVKERAAAKAASYAADLAAGKWLTHKGQPNLNPADTVRHVILCAKAAAKAETTASAVIAAAGTVEGVAPLAARFNWAEVADAVRGWVGEAKADAEDVCSALGIDVVATAAEPVAEKPTPAPVPRKRGKKAAKVA